MLRPVAVLAAALLAGLTPASAHNRKGDKFFKEAQKAEAAKDWDSALALYDQATAADPKDPTYLLYDQRIHVKAGQERIAAGRELLKAQKLDQALLQFQKAYLADPGSQIALQEIRTTTAMLKERAKAPAGTPIYTPAERARMEIEKRVNSLQGPPQLEPITAQISSLKVNNQPARVLYESVCKLAGLNLLLDPAGLNPSGGTGTPFNLDLNNVTIEEALNYVALITHTFWKPISRNTIFVTQEGQQKRQEYQDEVVKVFYIQNTSTPAEFQEIFNAVRVGAKMSSNVFQVTSQNAIVARGTPDTIALVEKLVHDLDRPKPEVMMDVIVLAVNKEVDRTLGAALLGQGGLSVPFNFTPRNQTPAGQTGNSGSSSSSGSSGSGSTTTTPQVTIAQLGHLSSADYSTTLPSTVVQALLNDSRTNILQRPQLRAIDGGKASLKIGQKIPYVSGSLNSAVATPGSIPYATTQFQQLEVGTLIDFQPHVSGPDDIFMHVRVELSNELTTVSIAGIDEPVVGQQIDEAEIRMKEGEVSILGGLSDQEYQNTLKGVPGFTNLPVLNYIFGSRATKKTDNQILIAVIPHIIRAPDYGDMANTGVYAGTESVPRVERSAPPSQPAQTVLPTPSGPATGIPHAANPNEVRPLFPVPAAQPANTSTAPATSVAPFPAATPVQQTPVNPNVPQPQPQSREK